MFLKGNFERQTVLPSDAISHDTISSTHTISYEILWHSYKNSRRLFRSPTVYSSNRAVLNTHDHVPHGRSHCRSRGRLLAGSLLYCSTGTARRVATSSRRNAFKRSSRNLAQASLLVVDLRHVDTSWRLDVSESYASCHDACIHKTLKAPSLSAQRTSSFSAASRQEFVF